MNYMDQVKRVKDQIDELWDEIQDGIDQNPGDDDFCRESGMLLVIIENLMGDVSRAINDIEEAGLSHLP